MWGLFWQLLEKFWLLFISPCGHTVWNREGEYMFISLRSVASIKKKLDPTQPTYLDAKNSLLNHKEEKFLLPKFSLDRYLL